ncbi:MAG TPA: IPT/TIG domain-containing protein, partial [Acidimicrobiales bacterium]|nr:IPT/TIG domain-containing protein [Acidimicrobiales bacterium]
MSRFRRVAVRRAVIRLIAIAIAVAPAAAVVAPAPTGAAPAPASTTARGAAAPVGVVASPAFAMTSLAEQVDNGGAFTTPPDTDAAASSTYVVEVVNSTLNVYARSSGSRVGTQVDLDSFFLSPSDISSGYTVSDPRVIYDAVAARWVVSAMSFKSSFSTGQGGRVHLAASDTDDPAGTWHGWTVKASTTGVLFDQPRLGLTTDKVLLSWDDYSGIAFGFFAGAEALAVAKDEVYSGVTMPATASDSWPSSGTPFFALVPAENQDQSATGWLVHNETDVSPPQVGVVEVTGTPGKDPVTFTPTALPARAGSAPPAAAQSGSSARIDTGDIRFLDAAWKGGRLWTGGSDGCVPAGDSATRSCGRLVEIDTTGSTPAIAQDFDFGAGGVSTMFPSVTFNGLGDLVVGYSTSSSSTFASFAAGGQLRSDVNRLSSTFAVKSGNGVYNEAANGCFGPGTSRWGDYSGASPDPASSLHAWVAGEFAAGASGSPNVAAACNWGTYAARVTFTAPSITAISPATVAAGGTMVVTGAGFTTSATVTIDGVAVTGVVSSSQQLTVTAPPHAVGSAELVVTTDYGTSVPMSFTYVARPVLSSIDPSVGPTAGGTTVTLSGAALAGVTAVRFGAAAAPFAAVDDSTVHATAPASVAGTVAVVVSTSGVESNAVSFTYEAPPPPPPPPRDGYRLAGSDGSVYAFGDAAALGDTAGAPLNLPVVGMAGTPSGDGYWLVASDGGIFAFGDAAFHGSTGAIRLNRPIVGMASTPSGDGYWLVATDGGIFAFGDAAFYGSTGDIHLNSPIVGM